MATAYVESSAFLRVALEGDAGLRRALAQFDRLVTSGFTWVEADRALLRARTGELLDRRRHDRARRWIDGFLADCAELVLEASVLSRARQAFPEEPVRTLDALPLASILAWDQGIDRLAVASCDRRVRANAAALGFDLIPRSGGGARVGGSATRAHVTARGPDASGRGTRMPTARWGGTRATVTLPDGRDLAHELATGGYGWAWRDRCDGARVDAARVCYTAADVDYGVPRDQTAGYPTGARGNDDNAFHHASPEGNYVPFERVLGASW